MKVGKYVDANNDILHVLKVSNGMVTYYWTDKNDVLLWNFPDRKGIRIKEIAFLFHTYKPISFNFYLDKL